MADKKNISPEVLAKAEKELADLRSRKQQIELALNKSSDMGREYTIEELEKENVHLQNEIERLTRDFGLK